MQFVFRFHYLIFFSIALLFLFTSPVFAGSPCFPRMTAEYAAYVEMGRNAVLVSMPLLLLLANFLTIKDFMEQKSKRNPLFVLVGIMICHILFFGLFYYSLPNYILVEKSDLPSRSIFSSQQEADIGNFIMKLAAVALFFAHLLFLFISKKILGNITRKQLGYMYLINSPFIWALILLGLCLLYIWVHPFSGIMYKPCPYL